MYIKYNQTLMKSYNERHTVDPIYLKFIDDRNEWLIERMKNECDAKDDLVFKGDDLAWGDFA